MKYIWRNGAVGWRRVGVLEKERLKKNCTGAGKGEDEGGYPERGVLRIKRVG